MWKEEYKHGWEKKMLGNKKLFLRFSAFILYSDGRNDQSRCIALKMRGCKM